MKTILTITILFLISCNFTSKKSPIFEKDKLDFLDSQNYIGDFEILNDWFLTSNFCKRKSDINRMEFSADIYFKYLDEQKWRANKHWYKNSDYEVKINNKRLIDFDNSFLYQNFEMWSSVISTEYFLNDQKSDNTCFDVKEKIIYKIYHHHPTKIGWELIHETSDKQYLNKLISKKTEELNNRYKGKKRETFPRLVEFENDIIGEYGSNRCDNSDLKLVLDKSTLYIDFFSKKEKGINARILASTYISKDKEEKSYYYKYNMLTGITRFNRALDWNNISQDSVIAKMTYIGDNKLELKWYGFYDENKKKRVDLISESGESLGLLNIVQLNKCP